MKKFFSLLTTIAIVASLASCSGNDDIDPVEATKTVAGFYTINGGNKGGKIPASITAYDYEAGIATDPLQDAFLNANGIALGDGAQTAVIYGSKMYIAMYTSNLIWVVDPLTLKIIKAIKPEGSAVNPRALAAGNGKIYASMYTGYVSVIDTLSLNIDTSIKVGSNPEQLGIAGDKLYVANSDGTNSKIGYPESSISIIDLKTLSETKLKDINKIVNPTDIVSNGVDVFVICRGNYADIPSIAKKIAGGDVVDVAPATQMTINGNKLYLIDSPYGKARKDVTFKVYDTSSLKAIGDIARQTEGTDSWVDNPNAIAVDPEDSNIVIISYTLSSSGAVQYREPCYANIYDKSGVFQKRIACGVGALAVIFLHTSVSAI